MKAKNLVIALLVSPFFGVLPSNAIEKLPTPVTQQEQTLVVKQEELYGENVVKVSFNAPNAGTGTLSVTDSKGNMVYYAEEFDLVASPNFNAISAKQLAAGELTFSLSTKVGTYKAVIIL